MFERIIRVLAEWSHREPAASLFMFVVAVLLFGTTFIRSRTEKNRPWLELSRLFSAFLSASIFVGILGAVYFFLDRGYRDFIPMARSLGSDEKTAYEISVARRIWGNYLVQQELSVEHTVAHQIVIPVPAPGGKTLYLNHTNVQNLQQESIAGFHGTVDIHLVDPRLNTYVADARYEYDVINYSDMETNAQYKFPIDPSHYYENVQVTVDGGELGAQKKIGSGQVAWTLKMSPRQRLHIVVAYSVRGLEIFYYRVPVQRGVADFSLKIRVNSPSFYTRTSPGEEAIKKEIERSESGLYTVTWMIDRAIMAPEVGIQFQPALKTDPLQMQAADIVHYVPRGSMLLGVIGILTLLICGISVDLGRLLLFLSVYSGQFLALIGLDLMKISYPISLPILSLATLWIVSVIYRELPFFSRRLILTFTLLFSIGYPLAGLLPVGPPRNAFDSLVQSVILLYVFGLSLYMRVRKPMARAPG